MAVKSFVLVKATPEKTGEILERLKSLRQPTLTSRTAGRFDSIIFLQTETITEIGTFVLNNVRKIAGVVDTLTLPVLREKIVDEKLISTPKTASAFVFAKVNPAATTSAIDLISSIPNVATVSAVAGEYDIAAFVSASSMDELSQTIFSIRNIGGIETTESYVVTG